ncbi:MAG: glycosyltransferase, partial [Chloroflexi bacterium]|nr:glycosyltransferase [Chloroflexota bacterium]
MLVKDRAVGGQAVQSGPTGQTVNQRVLHLIHSDQPRGAEVFAVELASHIEGNGVFDNGICTLYPGRNRSLPVGDLPMFRLDHRPGTLGRLGLDPGILRRLLRAMKEFRPDILVAHGSDTLKYSACASVFYRKAATIYRNIGTASIWANSPVKVGVNRLFLRRMDAVVSVSQYTGQDFMKLYCLPETRVTVIPNGVDAQAFQ